MEILPCKYRHCASSHNQKKDNNLNTKKQNWQKIQLPGSLTTKEIKKKHSYRPVGGVEMGSQGREDSQQGSGWWTQRGGSWWSGWSLNRVWINWEETGERDRSCNPGLQRGEIKPQTSDWKCPWGWGDSRRDSQSHKRGRWRDQQGPRVCTSPPTREPAPEGPNLIVGSREWLKPSGEWSRRHCSLSAPPPRTASQCSHQHDPAPENT